MEQNKLDLYLRPLALTTGKVVNRNIVKIIREWAVRKDMPGTLKLADRALATDATWFLKESSKQNPLGVKSLIPVTSIDQARELGLAPYEVPGFPEGYDPEARVGHQRFTYGELYAAWRGAFEDMIKATNDAYPFYVDFHGYPDYSVDEGPECDADDIVEVFRSIAEMTQEIDGMCVDFYFNDPWNEQADTDKWGIHFYDGIISPKDIRKEFLPASKKKITEGVPAISLRLTPGEDRLDTGRLSRGQVAKCRQVETWLAEEVATHAPEVAFSCQELRVNDDPGDIYIFCEVTIGNHAFNFYAGTDGSSALYEKVSEVAGPKTFEFDGGSTNAWVLDDFREFLGSII